MRTSESSTFPQPLRLGARESQARISRNSVRMRRSEASVAKIHRLSHDTVATAC
jgi:hypothetical protein